MSEAGKRLIGAAREAAAEVSIMLNPDKIMLALSSHIMTHYGPQCSEFDPGCRTCRMWAAKREIELGLEDAGAFSPSSTPQP